MEEDWPPQRIWYGAKKPGNPNREVHTVHIQLPGRSYPSCPAGSADFLTSLRMTIAYLDNNKIYSLKPPVAQTGGRLKTSRAGDSTALYGICKPKLGYMPFSVSTVTLRADVSA